MTSRRTKAPSKLRLARNQLGEAILHLRQIHSSVAVAAAALRQQNCELDEDIAIVLQRGVSDRIHEQLEKLESVQKLITALDRR